MNDLLYMLEMLEGKETFCRERQFSNAPGQILAISGILISLRDVQSLKQHRLRSIRFCGNIISLKFTQPSNAFSPISVQPSFITTLTISSLPLKTLSLSRLRFLGRYKTFPFKTEFSFLFLILSSV